MTDEFNAPSDPKSKGSRNFDPKSVDERYHLGIEILEDSNFKVIPEVGGPFAHHQVYVLKSPVEHGIRYPDEFKVWRKLQTRAELSLLEETILGMPEPITELFLPFLIYKRHAPIHNHAYQLVRAEANKLARDSHQPLELGISPDPILGSTSKEIREFAPRAFVPKKEWFDPKLYSLDIQDILNLFPEAEAELLALIIGRSVVGLSNHLPPGWTEPIKHTSRMAAIIVGEDPGLGKSTLFRYWLDAVHSVGYQSQTFSDLGAQFNLGEVVTADIIYKDDITDKRLRSLTESEVTKTLITATDLLRVEEKGENAYNVRPRGTLFVNSNNFNPRLVYGVDPGIADRLKLLATKRATEISEIERPHYRIPRLAEEYGVNANALLLYFTRLCADKFLDTLKSDTLKDRVEELTTGCQIKFEKDATGQLLSSVIFTDHYLNLIELGNFRGDFDPEFPIDDVDEIDWPPLLQRFVALLSKARRYPDDIPVLKWLKREVEESQNFDSLHSAHGFWNLSRGSLIKSISLHSFGGDPDHLETLCTILGNTRQKQGLPFDKDPVWVTKAYNKVRSKNQYLAQLAERCIKEAPLDPLGKEHLKGVLKGYL